MSEAMDLLSGGKAFPFEEPGDSVEGTITEVSVEAQTDLDSGEIKTWTNGKPIMMIVVKLQTKLRDEADDDGIRTVYFAGNKFTALKKSGCKDPKKGDYLKVTYTEESDRAPAKRGYSRAKLYSVVYKPGKSAGEKAAAEALSSDSDGEPEYGDKPDYLAQENWDAMPASAKAKLSPPPF